MIGGCLGCAPQRQTPGCCAWTPRACRVWVKTIVGADSDDEPAVVVALTDGLVACGRTQVGEETVSQGDLWVVRANVDGMLHFLADTGLACECTAAEWQRIGDHGMWMLTPTAATVTLEVDAGQELRPVRQPRLMHAGVSRRSGIGPE